MSTVQKGTKKPILVLTHHQPISSFQHNYKKPAEQLAQSGFFDGQEFVWLYGHEHRLTVYNKQIIANSLKVYPRCIGHGGMPVDVTNLDQPDPNILFYDPRQHPIDDQHPNTKVGYNGHVVLLIKQSSPLPVHCTPGAPWPTIKATFPEFGLFDKLRETSDVLP